MKIAYPFRYPGCSCLSILTYIFCLGTINPVYGQNSKDTSLRIMFYNVENAFDIYDDTLTRDEDFLPDGLMKWNHSRYSKKINSIYKTIVAAGEWEPPALIAFCEVENSKVLNDLAYGTYLSKFDYGIIHEDSPDRRGIDVCLIYRKYLIEIIHYEYWIPKISDEHTFDSRSILHAIIKSGSDTVHIIVNHWPSRKGGELASGELRHEIASSVKSRVDSLLQINSSARIIVTGDFNCTPDDVEMKMLVEDELLINLSDDKRFRNTGTYRYMGVWEMIDQILVSESLLRDKTGLHADKGDFRIFNIDFLLRREPKYSGSTPFATYRGYLYQGGFSDHLPVLIDLHFPKKE